MAVLQAVLDRAIDECEGLAELHKQAQRHGWIAIDISPVHRVGDLELDGQAYWLRNGIGVGMNWSADGAAWRVTASAEVAGEGIVTVVDKRDPDGVAGHDWIMRQARGLLGVQRGLLGVS